MKIKKRVHYSAAYTIDIEFDVDPSDYSEEEHGSFDDFIEACVDYEITDIEIPENKSRYVQDSFEVDCVENIPIPALEQLAGEAE